jgi:radical SAM superfamily enzyme YgiQ (UPF0313 family)
MHVLLVNPRFSYTGKELFPLGLGYLAAIALEHGASVEVVDENVGQALPWARLNEFDVIGLTVTTPAFTRVRAIAARLAREKCPGALVVAGGHHPTFRPADVLDTGIDVVVRGEGETVFASILAAVDAGDDPRGLPGTSFLGENGDVVGMPEPPFVEDLDAIPIPAHEFFPIDAYDPLSAITSRGCPYSCVYCGSAAFWRRKVRTRSTENVLTELDTLESLMFDRKRPQLKFQDSVFTLERRRTVDLLEGMANRQYRLRWTCETRADALDPELLGLMKTAGCKVIMLGLESGSQDVLDRAGRKMDVSRLADTCAEVRTAGIGLRASVIFGLPGETAQSVEDTLALVRQISPNVTFLNLATVYPGCILEDQARVAKHDPEWVATFGGHGTGGELVLPDGMSIQEYHAMAERLQREIHALNATQWPSNRERTSY